MGGGSQDVHWSLPSTTQPPWVIYPSTPIHSVTSLPTHGCPNLVIALSLLRARTMGLNPLGATQAGHPIHLQIGNTKQALHHNTHNNTRIIYNTRLDRVPSLFGSWRSNVAFRPSTSFHVVLILLDHIMSIPKMTLYDITSTLNPRAWSPNTCKVRYVS
ncbi:hypothetical protein FRC18_001615 [Serendipita sp. 400]|nr:hypothetical protein FRC18_001615 [Serendipita sp. 400]